MCYATKEYLIIGCDIINIIKKFTKQELSKVFSSINNLDIVYDEVNNNYCYVGKIVGVKEINDGNILHMSLIRIEDIFTEVKNNIKSELGLHCQPRLILFYHDYKK